MDARIASEPAPDVAAVATRSVHRVVLLILDGFGCREDAPDNAITRANAPNWRRLLATCPHTTVDASELRVGLPEGQMGNSEVGHLNIGAGRVVYQDFTRIDVAIRDGEFARNPVLADAVETARRGNATLHVLGLLSPGGVHSHERQIAAMVDMAADAGARVAVHAFLDGRDTPPRSAAPSLEFMNEACTRHGNARIASLCGRYYAMDRDKRWERIAPAYELLVDGRAEYVARSPREGLEAAYARGETDEFVKPTAIVDAGGRTARMTDGDVVVCMNFRADRARQMTQAVTAPDFDAFPRRRVPRLVRFVCLTRYADQFAHLPVAFGPQGVANGFGEYVSELGLRQLRIAETEKYAHVTYFFNGGTEAVYPGEDRVLVASPKVATYDLKPEMSAFEVTDRLVEAIASERYAAIVCNYANGDMVGHTGNFEAAKHAIEALDACLGRVTEAARAHAADVVITADHGNAERMHDDSTGQAHTAHTLNLVPFVYAGRRAASLDEGGALQDVAPTLLAIMGLPRPAEMTGRSLIHFEK
jgi:2,3-bisphosphoglycerate-independent phosphoglycerate mutase